MFHFHVLNDQIYIFFYISSKHFGATLYINGNYVASLTKPTVTPPHNNFPGIPKPLCVGLCGAKPGSGPYNLTMQNILVVGANVANLAKNNLLGLLGIKNVKFKTFFEVLV
jgi:hypothetical protein